MAKLNNSYSEFLEFQLEEVVSFNVKRLIKASSYSTEYLSNRTGLSIPTINRLKAGQHLSIKGICALAEVLNVSPCVFFMEIEK